jgi:hypothetical protein
MARPIDPELIRELHKNPMLWHLQDYEAIDATVTALREALKYIAPERDDNHEVWARQYRAMAKSALAGRH